jgi:hypothetical protein
MFPRHRANLHNREYRYTVSQATVAELKITAGDRTVAEKPAESLSSMRRLIEANGRQPMKEWSNGRERP